MSITLVQGVLENPSVGVEVVRMLGVIRKDDIVNYALNMQRNPKRYKRINKFALRNLNSIYNEWKDTPDMDWLMDLDSHNIAMLEDIELSMDLKNLVSILILRAAYALYNFAGRNGCTCTKIIAGTDEFLMKEVPLIERAMSRILNTKSGWVVPKEA